MIRKIIGFVPAALIVFLIWVYAALETRFFNGYVLRELLTVPWYMWIWLAAEILCGVMLCMKKTLVLGLSVGVIPWIILLIILITSGEDLLLIHCTAAAIMFYVIYAVCYFVYHHELEKK